jgi:hypothetical protein
VLLHIISQLRPGADLSRVVLPTFILEPRSMLERITKYDLSEACLARAQRSVATKLTRFLYAASWRTPKPFFPCLRSMTPWSDLSR